MVLKVSSDINLSTCLYVSNISDGMTWNWIQTPILGNVRCCFIACDLVVCFIQARMENLFVLNATVIDSLSEDIVSYVCRKWSYSC